MNGRTDAPGWMPIETAPKNGTRVVLATYCRPQGSTLPARWQFDEGYFWVSSNGPKWVRNGWYGKPDPIFWMPLPVVPPGSAT